jgi:hypothetical protein
MQAILIMMPILVYAFLTGLLLAYVLFVLLPRMRGAGRKRRPRGTPREH